MKPRDQKELELLLKQCRKLPTDRPDVMTVINGEVATRIILVDGAGWVYKMLKTKEVLLAEYFSTTTALVVKGLADPDLQPIIDTAIALGGEVTLLKRVAL
jgi:hypothetical protein